MQDHQASRLLQRVEALEAQVAKLAGKSSKPQPSAETAKQFQSLIDCMHKHSLTWTMKQFKPSAWPYIFFGLPRSTMEKVKDSMSKNAWRDMVRIWKDSPLEHAEYQSQQDFIDEARVQENMGQIVLDKPWGTLPGKTIPVEEALKRAFPETDGDFGEYLKQREQKAQEATQRWMASELEGWV